MNDRYIIVCPVCGSKMYGRRSPAQLKGFCEAGKATCSSCASTMQVIYHPEDDTMSARAMP